MKSIKILSLLLALIMCLGMFAGCGDIEDIEDAGNEDGTGVSSKYTEKNTTYKIGVSGPLTGGAAPYGVAVKNSAQMAVDEINAAGGLNGVKFELVVMDDKHDATLIPTNYAALYEGGMQVSLGTVTTAPGLEFKTLSKEDNVFFLTPSASGDKIPEFDNGYQMCFADGNQGKVAAEYVNSLNLTKIGVFYKSDDDYSKGIYAEFMKNIDASIKPSDDNIKSFTDSTSTSFTQQVEDLKDCDVIFMPIYYGPASTFMRQGIGVVPATTIYYGCDGFDGDGGGADHHHRNGRRRGRA